MMDACPPLRRATWRSATAVDFEADWSDEPRSGTTLAAHLAAHAPGMLAVEEAALDASLLTPSAAALLHALCPALVEVTLRLEHDDTLAPAAPLAVPGRRLRVRAGYVEGFDTMFEGLSDAQLACVVEVDATDGPGGIYDDDKDYERVLERMSGLESLALTRIYEGVRLPASLRRLTTHGAVSIHAELPAGASWVQAANEHECGGVPTILVHRDGRGASPVECGRARLEAFRDAIVRGSGGGAVRRLNLWNCFSTDRIAHDYDSDDEAWDNRGRREEGVVPLGDATVDALIGVFAGRDGHGRRTELSLRYLGLTAAAEAALVQHFDCAFADCQVAGARAAGAKRARTESA